MALATLTIDLVAKLASLERDMGKAAQIAEKNAKRMDEAFARVKTSLAAIGSVLTVGAFAGMVRSVADAGDQLQKLSTKTGATVEELSKLQYAASLSDLSNEDLGASLVKLNKVMGEAADGSKTAAEALARFGIAPESGLSTVEALRQIADKVKATGDETKVASALNDVFGKSFSTLIPLLKGGSDGLNEAGDELERMGGVMSGDLAEASEKLNDNMTRLSTQLEALKVQTVGPLIPLFEQMTKAISDSSDKANDLSRSGGALQTVFETVAVLGANVSYVIKQTGVEIGGMAAQLKALSTLDFDAFSNIGAAMKEDAKQARVEIDALSYRLLNAKDLAAASKLTDSWMPKSQSSVNGISETPPEKPAKPKRVGGTKLRATKADDDLGALLDDLKSKLDPAEQAIESFRKVQLDAAVAGADLTSAEKQFYDLINSDDWKTMSEPWRELVRAQFESANAAEIAASEQEKLNSLISGTPTAKLQEAADKLIFLADAYNAAKITAVQLDEASQAVLATIQDNAKEATDSMSTFADQAARNMQDAFADFLFDPFEDGVGGMLKGFGEALRRMIAEAVAADLASKVFGKAGGGDGSGLLGAGLDWLSGVLKNADGGVYMSPGLSAYSGQVVSHPTVFPFARGIGLMGEAGPEAILPLKRGADGKLGVSAGGGGGHTINVYVSGTNAPDVRRAAGQGAREALSAINGAGRYR